MLCSLTGVNPNDYRTKFPKIINGAITTVEITNPKSPQDFEGAGKIIELNAPPQ